MKRSQMYALVIVNAVVAGLILGNLLKGTPAHEEVPNHILGEIDSMARSQFSLDARKNTIIAVYHDVCSSCTSGASLDSLRAMVDRENIQVVLILLGDYRQLDIRNLTILWSIPFPVEVGSGQFADVLNAVEANHFFVSLRADGSPLSLFYTISELEEALR